MLNAQVQLTRARTTQQEALYDFNVALAEFDRATGANTVYSDSFNDPIVDTIRAEKNRASKPAAVPVVKKTGRSNK